MEFTLNETDSPYSHNPYQINEWKLIKLMELGMVCRENLVEGTRQNDMAWD